MLLFVNAVSKNVNMETFLGFPYFNIIDLIGEGRLNLFYR